MSSLEIGPRGGMGSLGKSFFQSAAEGWGPFTVFSRKEERKEKKDVLKAEYAERAQTFEQQRALAQEEARAQALEDLRDKVTAKLEQLEAEANVTTGLVLKIREEASSPVLDGDPILEDLGQALADMEKAVVTIQAATVVDVATFDSYELAGAYSDAHSALVAMKTVTARAQGILKELSERIKQINDEKIRAQMAAEDAAIRRAAQERRDRQIAAQQQAAAEELAAEEERRRRREVMAQVMAIQAEVSKEKRRLSAAKVELASLQFSRAESGRIQASRVPLSGWFF